MVVDTSALAAILFAEEGYEDLVERLDSVERLLLSAASLVELSIVVESRKGEEGARQVDLLLYRTQIEVVPVDVEQAEIAREAWRRFGKGRHPASLNFGDCFSYALAKQTGLPLLFKGADFSLTDLA
jgi:ribonuclease VapC